MSTPQDFETLLRDFTESVRRHAMDPNRHNANDLVYEREVIRAYVAKLTPIWRSEPPNEPGWYWCRWEGLQKTAAVLEITRRRRDGTLIIRGGLKLRAEWSGPLQPPQEKA